MTTALFLGTNQLSTRMYSSLVEIVRGWRKNVFAGGIDALPRVRLLRLLFPLGLTATPLAELAPVVVLVAAAAGVHFAGSTIAFAATATSAMLVAWAVIYARAGRSIAYALAFPLGAAVLLWIVTGAIARGRRVTWKGRRYESR